MLYDNLLELITFPITRLNICFHLPCMSPTMFVSHRFSLLQCAHIRKRKGSYNVEAGIINKIFIDMKYLICAFISISKNVLFLHYTDICDKVYKTKWLKKVNGMSARNMEYLVKEIEIK